MCFRHHTKNAGGCVQKNVGTTRALTDEPVQKSAVYRVVFARHGSTWHGANIQQFSYQHQSFAAARLIVLPIRSRH